MPYANSHLSAVDSKRVKCPLVNDAELSHPPFIRAIRTAAYEEGVEAGDWLEHLYNLLRDAESIIDRGNGPVDITLNEFEASDRDFDTDAYKRTYERMRDWFGSNCCSPVDPDKRAFVRPEARERFRILATILCAYYPERARGWPRIIPANDNDLPAR